MYVLHVQYYLAASVGYLSSWQISYWPSNIRIDSQAFVFASEFNFNLRKYVNVQGKIKSYINQIITLQNIGIKFK